MSLHARLRRDTHEAHLRVEAAFRLEEGLASRAAYAGLLRRLHAFHRAFEDSALPHLGGTPFESVGGRARDIEADLSALGEPTARVRPEPLVLAGRPEAVGAAYVVEGSLLGGLVIARTVERRLGLGPQAGASFFAGHGRATASRWRGFCEALDASADPATDGRVIEAASRTFAFMGALLTRPGLVPA